MNKWSTGHGPGFSFIDTFKLIDKTKGVGTKFFNRDADFFKDHFPKKPILPAVYIIECSAQAAGILWSKIAKKIFSKKIYGIAGVEKFNFYKLVLPDKELSISVEYLSSINNLGRFKVVCSVEDDIVAQGIILMAKMDKIL